jgi:hypothetical protein
VTVSSAAGRACRVVITAAGTAALAIYDGPSSTGTVYDIQLPVATSIVAVRAANTPGAFITYTKDTPYGR